MSPPTPMFCRREFVTPWSLQAHLDLASCYLVPTLARPTCRRPRETYLQPPPPVAQSAQPSFVAPAFTVHRYLLLYFPSKPNKMFMTLWSENLRFIESRNCAFVVWNCGLVVFHVCVFTDEWWTKLMLVIVNWLCAAVACDFFLFFGFLALWLCHFVFVTLSLVYIDKRDRERETESRVCRD